MINARIRLKQAAAFTYIELLIAAVIFIIISVALIGTFATFYLLMEDSITTSIALNDAQNVIEQIRAIEPFELVNVNNFIATFNEGSFHNLPNESVDIDPNIGADPFRIEITVSWQELKGRDRNLKLITYMTQR